MALGLADHRPFLAPDCFPSLIVADLSRNYAGIADRHKLTEDETALTALFDLYLHFQCY
jgi:hypothetical protein